MTPSNAGGASYATPSFRLFFICSHSSSTLFGCGEPSISSRNRILLDYIEDPVSLVLPRVHDEALRPRCLLGLCPILLCLSFLFWVLIHSAECSIATGGLTLLPGRSVIDPIVTNSSRGDPFLQLSLGDNNARKARNEACATSAQRLGSLDGACETGGEQVGFMARSWESFCDRSATGGMLGRSDILPNMMM